ncbi:MAG: hypothetical protein IJB79_07330 [Candidatus Gastranaerophilales bacterium]|nr:hypothetical protein [Candidatus Gastranaerophilales bacterium]
MSANPLKLKIAYLYPDILYGFSDQANVEAFVTRAKWRDINVQVSYIKANERIQSSKFDFYYIGGSNIKNLEDALFQLKQNELELNTAVLANVPMLAVNCGYMLFGNFYQLHNQSQIEAMGILNVDSIAGKSHHWGNISGVCEFLKNKTVAGFENHGILSYLKEGVAPFLTLQRGKGNNGRDKTEGARVNNVIGTYITSPILAQNPHLCDFLIATALRIKYKCRIPLTPLCDDIEWYSHNFILDAK